MVLMNAAAAFGQQTDLAQCLELFDRIDTSIENLMPKENFKPSGLDMPECRA
jgi:hypothetical protein